jgi:hypothetical protein
MKVLDGCCFGRRSVVGVCFLSLCLFAIAQGSRDAGAATPSALPAKPYRVLLVVDQWSDPSSLVVNSEKDKFQPVAALLKAWSVPFDVLRLNQQHLDATYLFLRSGAVRYGVAIWLADSSSYDDQDVASLDQAARAGMGLIVAHSRFLDPTLNKLLGLKFNQLYASTDTLRLVRDHYITRDLSGKNSPPIQDNLDSDRVWVAPTTAEVLMTQGDHPVVTVNQMSPDSSAVWLGTPTTALLSESAFWRNLLFRSLVWSLGYVVVPNMDYNHRIVFELDDWGTADKGFLGYWHYLEPSEETIRQYLLLPLKQHHGSASAMVDTGYVDRQSKRVVSPWTQQFTDAYGLHQDFASTRAGLKDGIAEGLLNIESHGWTHMQPDLESPPGPWWTADMAGAGSLDGWYVEFQDRRRDKEVPAVAQMYHMERSLTELQQDFGVQALELKPGGDAWSKSQFNNTAQLAARVGFGLFHGDVVTYYLDHQLVLDMAAVVPDFDTLVGGVHPEQWPAHPDGPLFLGFHDRDIALNHSFMDQLFAALPAGYRTMETNEYIGILHTEVNSSSGGDNLQLTFAQDNHYCAYFDKHDSSWQLWLADPLREELAASHPEVFLDGKPVRLSSADLQHESLAIDLPPGLATHTWRFNTRSSAKQD